jgi:hypothetical protein
MGLSVPVRQHRAFKEVGSRTRTGITGTIVFGAIASNAWVAAFGFPVWGAAWRQGFHIVSMAIVTITALILIFHDAEPQSRAVRVIPVIVGGTAWMALRLAPDIFGMEAMFGSAIGNAPLEVAVITFFGARHYKWPEHWLASLCVVSYSLYAFLPPMVPSAVRDMPVTFSFVLFTCLVITWCIRGWRRESTPG